MVRPYDEDAIPTVYDIDEMPAESRGESTRRYFRGLDVLMGFNRFEPGYDAEPHAHPWEQVNFVLEGACHFRVGDERVSATEGEIFFVPPDVPHTVEPGDEPCTVMFVGPLREDYLDDTAYQEEFGDG